MKHSSGVSPRITLDIREIRELRGRLTVEKYETLGTEVVLHTLR